MSHLKANERRNLALQAAERRISAKIQPTKPPHSSLVSPYTPFDHGHPKRSALRRMLDDIVEKNKNTPKQAIQSLQTLRELAGNILSNKMGEAAHSVRMHAKRIYRDIYRPPGVLEYLTEMGFRLEVTVDNDTKRVWSENYRDDLVLCADLLDDIIAREQKTPDEKLLQQRKLEEDKDAWDKAARRIHDDRKSVALRVQRERQAQSSKSQI